MKPKVLAWLKSRLELVPKPITPSDSIVLRVGEVKELMEYVEKLESALREIGETKNGHGEFTSRLKEWQAEEALGES